MIIGIPKEIMQGEARVAATPETVKKFCKDGITILVESGAGFLNFRSPICTSNPAMLILLY